MELRFAGYIYAGEKHCQGTQVKDSKNCAQIY